MPGNSGDSLRNRNTVQSSTVMAPFPLIVGGGSSPRSLGGQFRSLVRGAARRGADEGTGFGGSGALGEEERDRCAGLSDLSGRRQRAESRIAPERHDRVGALVRG